MGRPYPVEVPVQVLVERQRNEINPRQEEGR